jgi:hypothetical protein
MASKVINISLPEKWGQIVEEYSALTGESMASLVSRATIAYLEELVASGVIERLQEQRSH